MAYFTNDTSTTTMADFITKLNTFLTTGGAGNPGWTADHLSTGNGEWAISKDDGSGNSVEVAFQWDTGGPSSLAIHQYISGSGAGNYNSGVSPWQQTDDSGNGAAGTSEASIVNSRCVNCSNDVLQYWAFTGDTWAYIVVQVNNTDYTHFGFGVLDKFNDWTGGEFAYGQRVQGTYTSEMAVREGSTVLLDGLCKDAASPNPTNNQELVVATIHCEGLPGQPAGGKWAVVMGDQSDLGQDRQGTPKDRALFLGGYRAGEVARSMGVFLNSPQTGFVPMYPIPCLYYDRSTPAIYGPMGIMPGVRGVNIDNYVAGDDIVIGSETWCVFPSHYKSAAGVATGTVNQGIAYLKST